MNREEKIRYLQAIREGKQPKDEFLYNLLTLQELNTLHELFEKYGSIEQMPPEELRRIEAIEKKYNERVKALTKDELDLIQHDYKYFTIGEQAVKVKEIRERLQII